MKKGCTYNNKQDLVNNNMKNSVNLGEFLPLITTTSSSTTTTTTGTSSNVVGMSEQPSSRWNPTGEQLLALEEMYRRGTRTPSADQIQQIASQLRRFGKIEGKNVFYWFQNHKARERQKRRREADTTTTTSSKLRSYIEQDPVLDNKHSGLNPSFQLQQKKSLLVSSPNCNESLEGHLAMQRGGGTEESTVTHNGCCITKKNDTWRDPPKTRLLNNNIIINEENIEVETLELFPVFKNEESNNNNNNIRRRKVNNNKDKDKDKDRKVPTKPINNKQYFVFLN